MRLQAALQSDLNALLQAELRAAERAVTAGVRQVTDGLKTELRGQITGAGLGTRLANTWRGEVYPKGQQSIGAAGFVWSKAPGLVRLYGEGAVIRSKQGLFLAIPMPAAGRFGDGRRKITPGTWERIHGTRLRFVYRRGRPSLLVADGARLTRRLPLAAPRQPACRRFGALHRQQKTPGHPAMAQRDLRTLEVECRGVVVGIGEALALRADAGQQGVPPQPRDGAGGNGELQFGFDGHRARIIPLRSATDYFITFTV